MTYTHIRSAVAVLAVAIAGLGFAAVTNAAGAPSAGEHGSERLVVRGDATVVDAPCDASGCPLQLADGSFRGTPVGTGGYDGAVTLAIADVFENGEGGVCAPIHGEIVLGAGSADRLVLAVSGDSCQDGAGDPRAASFTGLARFTVKYGTGEYAGTRGSGLATFLEGADDHDRMTLIGRITR
jgi:hypothetical protein